MNGLQNFGFRKLAAPMVIAAATIVLSGCASTPAPTEQIALSKAAVASATSAGAGEYAPVEMKSAADKLTAAQRAFSDKDYERARQLAEQAQVDAKLAESTAQAAKAQKAITESQEGNRVLREEMNRKQ
jgi:membrane-associated HD superfamily phosphohydrolase